MKGNPAVPEGSLTSKPTRPHTSGCSTTVAFSVVVLSQSAEAHKGVLTRMALAYAQCCTGLDL